MPGFDEFQVVRLRRFGRRRFVPPLPGVVGNIVEPEIDTGKLLRTVLDAVISLRNSPYRQIIYDGLAESLSVLNKEVIPEIVCYGLGNFSECRAAKHQLAALLTIKSRYQSRVHLYDPVFFSKEIEVLKTLGLFMIETNEGAQRKAGDNLTLFYMPHLSKGLIANCVYANWGIDLNNCIFMTNSFSEMVEDIVVGFDEEFKDSVELIKKAYPFVDEIPLKDESSNTEHPLSHAFNSTSIHVFPISRLLNASGDIWISKAEKMNSNLQLIRSLLREIRHVASEGKIKDNIMVQYILEQSRTHKETSETLCKAREELKHLALTYNCYLNSQRVYNDIHTQYAGVGERSVRETADLVGFKLPHDPK